MIATIKLTNTFISSHNHFFFFFDVVTLLQSHSHSRFQVYNTVLLTTVSMLDITSPELIHLITEILSPLSNISPFPQPHSPWQLSFTFWL